MRNIVTSLVVMAGLIPVAAATAEEPAQAEPPAPVEKYPRVRIETSLGSFVVELDRERAPLTVENFLRYVDAGFYSGTVFHRVINGFVAQGGGYTTDLAEKTPFEPIFNEAGNGLKNLRGTIGMARTSAPHTATAQFFINLVDNDGTLDPLPSRWGYAVFGKVIEGMDVVDKIAHVRTGPAAHFEQHVPDPLVVIEQVQRVEPSAASGG